MSFAPQGATLSPAEQRLYDLAEAHYERKFARFPLMASELGRHEFDGEMGKPDEKTFKADLADVESLLAEVEALPPHNFSGGTWLDRRALLAQLRTERLNLAVLKTWRTNPNRYASSAVDGVLSLVVRNADNLAPVAGAIESRLKGIPKYLQAAESVIKSPVPLWAKLAVQTCAGVDGFLDSLVEPLVAVGSDRAKLAKRIAAAKAAFAAYSKAVARRKTGPKNGYCIGTDNFEMLVRERLGLNLTAREAEAMGRSLAREVGEELEAEVRKHHPTKSASEVLADARAAWKPEGELLDLYKTTTQTIRELFAVADAVGFPPGESLVVKQVPDFLRHEIPTAAYMSPGPYDDAQVGIFWVNDMSKTKTTDEDKSKELAGHFGMPLTCAHEAYPGHHLQFCTANRNPSKLRRLFSHAVYYEGWTLWCEQMTVDLGVDTSPHARLQQLHDALWRAHRIIIDCGLHTGTMTAAEAVKHLMSHLGFSKARATAEINWYSQSPTVPMSYLIGKTEVLRLKRKRVDAGGWSLRKFNDWLLSWGTVPQTWIDQAEG